MYAFSLYYTKENFGLSILFCINAYLFKGFCTSTSGNDLNIINPCYPSYAIRDIYTHDGFDYLLLVEDELAKIVVKKAIEKLELENSRSINVLPVGGWFNVLKLQYKLMNQNVLGVEKFLLNVLIIQSNMSIKKKINDKFFSIESIDNLISQYTKHERETQKLLGKDFKSDNDGKRLYQTLLRNLIKRRIIEESFIYGLYEIIQSNIDFSKFHTNMKKELNSM